MWKKCNLAGYKTIQRLKSTFFLLEVLEKQEIENEKE